MGIRGCQAPRTFSFADATRRGRAVARVIHYIFVTFICLRVLCTHMCLYRHTRYTHISEIYVGGRLHVLYNIRINDSMYALVASVADVIFLRIFSCEYLRIWSMYVNAYLCDISRYNPCFRILFAIGTWVSPVKLPHQLIIRQLCVSNRILPEILFRR